MNYLLLFLSISTLTQAVPQVLPLPPLTTSPLSAGSASGAASSSNSGGDPPPGSQPGVSPDPGSQPGVTPQNPWPNGIPLITSEPGCVDGNFDPSEQCLESMNVSIQGNLWQDSSCGLMTLPNRQKLGQSFVDAYTLANKALALWPGSQFVPTPEPQGNTLTTIPYYIGSDILTNQSLKDNVYTNLWRLASFHGRSVDHTRITVHCNDPKMECAKSVESGKTVGGYSWTVKHWAWWWSYHINMCDNFYSVNSLQEAQKLANGPTGISYVGDLTWLQSTASYIIHEMMHTRYVSNSPPNPTINDENLNPVSDGDMKRAYMPWGVWKLAHLRTEIRGLRSSQNADSYAQLVNALYWFDYTGHFPGVPGKGLATASTDSVDSNDTTPDPDVATVQAQPIGWYLGDLTDNKQPFHEIFQSVVDASGIEE